MIPNRACPVASIGCCLLLIDDHERYRLDVAARGWRGSLVGLTVNVAAVPLPRLLWRAGRYDW
jgi:hypothetical protein